jgi:hypothetical protein
MGVPDCCHAHRRHQWTGRPVIDPTWAIVSASHLRDRGDRHLEVEGPWQTNIFWRWLGICAMPHLPCSLDCDVSRTIADSLLELGRQAGYVQEMDWMREVLSWPVEWTALHGVVIVSTPILKITARTDPTDERLTIRRHGEAYPTEGAAGLCFPYRQQTTRRFSDSKAFSMGVNHVFSSTGASA